MDENREEILENFQSITGVSDIAEALLYLEECNWDLLAAINRVLPAESQDLTGFSATNCRQNDLSTNTNNGPSTYNNSLNNIQMIDLTEDSFQDMPSTSTNNHNHSSARATTSFSNTLNQTNRPIKFKIRYNSTSFDLILNENQTILDLKKEIEKRTDLPPCQQFLRGWIQSEVRATNENTTKFSDLLISYHGINELAVTELKDESAGVSALQSKYGLNIKIIAGDNSERQLNLEFTGDSTVLDVKSGVYAVTNIPVRNQTWTGWPREVFDTTLLGMTGITRDHQFLVIEKPSARSNSDINNRMIGSSHENSDSSIDDEFEDAADFNNDDDLFRDTTPYNPLKPLIPDNVGDEVFGCQQFIMNYKERYGEPSPLFFEGSLEDSVREACHKSAKDRQLLAIYLHHDQSVLTHVFCDKYLKSESVMQTLSNFVVYGWDLTFRSNKDMFLSAVRVAAGNTASVTVRNLQMERLPAFLIIGKTRGICELLNVIYGSVGVDELVTKLMESIQMYSELMQSEIRDENERAEREQVKMEQDAAYKESLEADRKKEEVKRQKEIAIATERQRIESEQAELEAKREAIRMAAECALPPEPAAGGDGIAVIRFRIPSGEILTRRFLADSPLRDIINFVTSKGFPVDEYKIISSWPRRDLTTLEVEETLRDLKLYPQETVIMEER